jgi:hypothetical protein
MILGFGGDFTFVIYKTLGRRFAMSKMSKRKLLTIMYKNITNEEREGELKHDVQIFNEQVV